MNILTDKEWKNLLDIVLMLNNENDLDVLRKDFLTLLRLLITFDRAEFSLAKDDYMESNPVAINLSDDMLHSYKNYVEKDALNLLYSAPRSIVYRESDASNAAFLKSNEYYSGYLKTLNTPYSCLLIIIKERAYLGNVTLYNFESTGNFVDKDLFIMELLADHVASKLYRQTMCPNPPLSRGSDYNLLLSRLTVREAEIVELLLSGKTNKNIAEALYICETTVKKHLSNIYNKIGISTRAELINHVLHLRNRSYPPGVR